MKTEIFKDYAAFLDRGDPKVNGVTQEFADANKGWDEERNNEACWNCSSCSSCSDCSSCSSCSDCRDCSYCSYCSDCSDCRYCSDCRDCSDCSSCSDCRDCSYCSYCSYCSSCSSCRSCSSCSKISGKKDSENGLPSIPKIKNIHQSILAAIEDNGNQLNMSDWHTCETTHCRAGWAVHLAGKPGYELEAATSTEFAAKMIYKESSPIHVSPVKFFTDNVEAMEDIKRCAIEEKALSEQ